MKNKVIIIIPAYNPTLELIKLVKKLKQEGKRDIVIVNDGSNYRCSSIFEKLNNCIIINNGENFGKGIALKNAFKYILKNEKNLLGVVTADADGQHSVKDIIKVCNYLENNKDNVILGCRNFNQKNIPLCNKIGNKVINYICKKKLKSNIKDTQTGLRGIPFKYIKEFSNIYGRRYEYEINVLKYIIRNNINFKEVEIKTIYNNNKSYYRKIRDSIKILKSTIIDR